MSMFASASSVIINDGHFMAQSVQALDSQERGKDRASRELEQHVAFGAFHNSKERHDPPKCLPRTREAVFRDIVNWIRISSTEKPILWLYGPAGAGKSAIAQSIAEKIYRREIEGCLLVATFFCNRSNTKRNNIDNLIPSLAYQMTFSIPETREFVLRSIAENPHVFSLNLRTQMEKLIVEPLLSAGIGRSSSRFSPMLIIIDGLDECQESQERAEFVQTLTQSVANPSFHLIILCHSRPESDIRTAFNDPQTSGLSTCLVLDSQFKPDSDIRTFLNHYFSEIKRIHPLKNQIPRGWPPKGAVDNLIMKSSGQFIYASTTMNYIASRKHNPMNQLDIVLDLGSSVDASPFKELDALYTHVLSSIDANDRPTLVRILGMIYFQGLYGVVEITPRLIDDALSLEPGKTLLILNDLHSLIDVGGSDNGLETFHASFSDFLEDRSRSAEYHVDHSLAIADGTLAYFKARLDTITNASPVYKVLHGGPEGNFPGKLTIELYEFFKSIPWHCLLRNGLPKRVPSAKELDCKDCLVSHVYELYVFCRMAADTSPVWVSVSYRALTQIATWMDGYLSRLSSLADPNTVCSFQNILRECYVLRLLNIRGKWNLKDFIIEILLTPGLSNSMPISRQQHNLAIFDTILEGLVTCWFVNCWHDQDYCLLFSCSRCCQHFVHLLNLADRTACIEALLPYFEERFSPVSTIQDEEVLRDIAKVKQAISQYKKQSIPNDYQYDFRLEPGIELLRKRYKKECKVKGKFDSRLLDLQVCHFNPIENPLNSVSSNIDWSN